MLSSRGVIAFLILGSLSLASSLAVGASTDRSLEERIVELERIIQLQQEMLERQQEELNILKTRARGLPSGAAPDPPIISAEPHAAPLPKLKPLLSQADPPGAEGAEEPAAQPIDEPPLAEPERPEVQAIPELGGVLTPAGTLVFEPSFEYIQSNINRFTFRGIEIVEAVLIGVIEATDADRDTLIGEATFRYGVTDRLELEASVPYVYRSDRITTLVDPAGTGEPQSLTDRLDGMGIGDVEAAVHYQINDGRDGWPIFVGNLRGKSTTGTGPFDVDRDVFGVPTELATGSGFYSIEPSVTAIYPTDPAVLFANVGYNFHLPDDVDKQVGDSFIGRVDPGDSLGVSFGLGVSLNERTSLTLGYQHDFVNGSTTEINGREFESESLDVGSLLFGMSYRVSPDFRLNLNTKVGVTEDAPDVSITLRAPISFELF
ncbi:MAG: transporter [Kiloniellales bacterium]